MDEKIARKLQSVGKVFNLPGPFFSYEEITIGNVNQTYKINYIVDDGTGMAVIKPYLMQKINSYAFHNADELMSNIDKVTEFIRAKRPDEVNMHFHHTDISGERKTYFSDDAGFWRVYKYIPAVTFDKCDDVRVIRNAGKAFGDFQTVLSDFPVEELNYTIQDFHNTRKRYETFLKDTENDPCGRAAECREEIDYLVSVMKDACTLSDLYHAGKLPLRVTHNDTKINNVLFNEKTFEPMVVIDLDTVMPGLVGDDFGDAIRSAANFEDEDSENLEKVGLDLNVFWAFADGFLSKTAKTLTEQEVSTLAMSSFCITCELATRFLDDYLIGDKYFKVKKDKHNLHRARCQIALAKDIYRKKDSMQAIIDVLTKKYRNE